MTKLLIDEPPLQVLPSLALKIGLHEAIVIQQVHFWILTDGKEMEGEKWVYNSATQWQKQFPWWHRDTIKKLLKNMEQRELLVTSVFNKLKADRTKWYRVNYCQLFPTPGALDPQALGENHPLAGDATPPPLPKTGLELETSLPKTQPFFDALKEQSAKRKLFTDYFQTKHLEAHKMKPEFPPFRWLWTKVQAFVDNHPFEEVKRRVDNFFEDGFLTSHSFKQFMDDPDKFIEKRVKFEKGSGGRGYAQPEVTDWKLNQGDKE